MFARLFTFGCYVFENQYRFQFRVRNWWRSLAVVPGAKRIIGYRVWEALLFEDPVGVRARLHLVSRKNRILQNVLGFEERMIQHTFICKRSDESS